MTETQNFHVGDILTLITGRLVGPGGMDALQELLDFMTDDAIFTHQIPRVADECAPELRAQYPDLAAVVPPDFGDGPGVKERVDGWITEQVARFGEMRPVARLRSNDHVRLDPMVEMVKMINPTVR